MHTVYSTHADNGKGKAVFIKPSTDALTTYSEAVCHAGQHKEKVYTTMLI